MSGFSNFITKFNGTTRTENSNIDIISNYVSVSSNNSAYGHTGNDYYFYLGNLLIQFSGTPISTLSGAPLTNGNSYIFTLPGPKTSTNVPWVVLVSDVSSSNTIVNVTSIGYNVNSNVFTAKIGNANGNFSWIAIGPAS